MKITTFPKITENPFKKYGKKDFSLKTLLNQTWKKHLFEEKKGAFIYISSEHLDISSNPPSVIPSVILIPSGMPKIPNREKPAKGINGMSPFRPTLDYRPLENKVELSSFQGVYSHRIIEEDMMTEFLAVPDDIMTNMIRYVLSQDFIEKQKYTMDVPFGETLILDGGSDIHDFIIGKHHSKDSNLEIFYDPKQKGFVYSVWKEDEKYPSFIYTAMKPCENSIIYLEKKEKTLYTLYRKNHVSFCGGVEINTNPGSLGGKKLDLINNYFQAKNLEKIVVDDEIKILKKNEIENILKIGMKLKYRFHNYK